MRINLIHRKRDDQELREIKKYELTLHNVYMLQSYVMANKHIVLPCFVRVPMHIKLGVHFL